MTAEELSSVNERYEALEASIRTYNPNADFDKIRRAFAYARDKHIHQRRKDGSPYITHPLAVAQVVSDSGQRVHHGRPAARLHRGHRRHP